MDCASERRRAGWEEGGGDCELRCVQWRCAFIIARAGGESHELRVNIANASSASVLSHVVHRSAALPTLTLEEQFVTLALPPKHPPFVESVRGAGWTWTTCSARCSPSGGSAASFYERPLQGVTLVVDLNKEERSEGSAGGSGGRALTGWRGRMVDGEESAFREERLPKMYAQIETTRRQRTVAAARGRGRGRCGPLPANLQEPITRRHRAPTRRVPLLPPATVEPPPIARLSHRPPLACPARTAARSRPPLPLERVLIVDGERCVAVGGVCGGGGGGRRGERRGEGRPAADVRTMGAGVEEAAPLHGVLIFAGEMRK
uniref:Copper amine oxidase-like n=1 Tax=Oryza sativa subsp. japonica TaxID=39947 RepID=Q69UD6_ORYSJ|nr:copper amine oxidase-like [Oryza sativa Japonica Group]BAD33133.1 copper amine oxidase-like [Oryza sativa Japonica Group]